jgi:hypothetical protein
MAAGSNNIVTDGLVACWDAGNRRSYPGTGTSWTALGAGSAGTLANTPSFVDGKMGYFTFDGTDEYAEFELDTLTLSEGSSGSAYDESTIVLWVQWGPGDTNGCVFAANHPSGGDTTDNGFRYPSWGFFNSSGGIIYFTSGVTQSGQFDAELVEDEWVQITMRCRFGSSGNPYYGTSIKAWINGIEFYDASGPTGYFLNEGAFRIASGDGACWEGSFASIHVYNRELTDAEVKQNYEATKSRFAPRIAKRGMNLNFDAGDPASYAGGTTTWKDTANGLTTVFNNMDASNFNSSNGGYFAFDGTDEWMTAPNSPLFQSAIADQGTFAAWYNVDEAGDDSDPNVPIWAANANGSRATWSTIHFDSPKQAGLGAKLGGSWSDIGRGTTVLSYDTWYYVVFTWDKANTQVKCYINGALDDTDSTSSASISTSTTGWLSIGATLYNRANTGTPWSFLSGFIGVLQLYDSVLSAAEVMDNFQKTRGRFGV